MSVELFDAAGNVVLGSEHPTPLAALFREYRFEPGIFAECARRCLKQTFARPAVFVDEQHGLSVVGSSLVLEGEIVGAAVAGYALTGFSQVASVRRWARSAQLPFDRLWNIVRSQPPLPERRLLLHGELLQVLGDALLRENYRTRQYQDAAAQLKAASAAKDEFLAVLSHELRTPLAPIAGWASILKKSDDFEEVHKGAEAIERNAFLQARMVDDLLDMSRIMHGKMQFDVEIVDVRAIVQSAAADFAGAMAAKSLRCDFPAGGEPLLVEGDAGRLQQIFRNLLSNAVKFTPAGGSIRVAIESGAHSVCVAVADTGKGVDPRFLPFVFDIFRQQEPGPRREHQGLGIGLSLVKRLTELHGGTVSVASAGPGRGTEVTVCIPLATRAPDRANGAEPDTGLSAPAFAGRSVLVIDDERDGREALQHLLQHLGMRVAVAGGGAEALKMTQQAPWDIILCDLRMPGMDGYEFMRELRRGASPEPPVVAVSALASDADRARTREAGFVAHIGKPYSEAELLDALKVALGHPHLVG